MAYAIEYSRSNRATCQGLCKSKIARDELRLGSVGESDSFGRTSWRHFPDCVTARLGNNVIRTYGSERKIPGFDDLTEHDQHVVEKAFKSLSKKNARQSLGESLADDEEENDIDEEYASDSEDIEEEEEKAPSRRQQRRMSTEQMKSHDQGTTSSKNDRIREENEPSSSSDVETKRAQRTPQKRRSRGQQPTSSVAISPSKQHHGSLTKSTRAEMESDQASHTSSKAKPSKESAEEKAGKMNPRKRTADEDESSMGRAKRMRRDSEAQDNEMPTHMIAKTKRKLNPDFTALKPPSHAMNLRSRSKSK